MTVSKCPHTILVVEDDYDIREAIKDFLELEDYQVVTATNGKEALEVLKTGLKPCLVLLDMMMPIMGGREFLDIVLKDSVLAPIPIFILSAIASSENTKGAVGFIKKPADLHVLLSMVKTYC
ncbi:MAG TPA: response regulator [Bacteriovoracaceae bacterium]|nr:response regulator [Bacteriovoracaceae bacterium]